MSTTGSLAASVSRSRSWLRARGGGGSSQNPRRQLRRGAPRGTRSARNRRPRDRRDGDRQGHVSGHAARAAADQAELGPELRRRTRA